MKNKIDNDWKDWYNGVTPTQIRKRNPAGKKLNNVENMITKIGQDKVRMNISIGESFTMGCSVDKQDFYSNEILATIFKELVAMLEAPDEVDDDIF